MDHEDFEECGNLDFYGPEYAGYAGGCLYIPYRYARRIKQGAGSEEAMAQVRKNSLFQENCQRMSRTICRRRFGRAPAEWEALRKEYGQHTILLEQ